MVPIWAKTDSGEGAAVAAWGNGVQHVYHFGTRADPGAVPVRFVAADRAAPFQASRGSGVVVTTWQSAPISVYAGIPRAAYMGVLSLLGVAQYRALALNPLLHEEDLLRETPCGCLFARRLLIEEYALLFESPHLCSPCRRFYQELLPRDELRALLQAIAMAGPARDATWATPVPAHPARPR